MDKNVFTRKVIEEISKPAQPGTFQGSEYVACFASLYRAIEKNGGFSQQDAYYKFAPVAGINFTAYNNEITANYFSFDACAKINGLDDYVEYTMGYAGYKYTRIIKDGQSKDNIYKQITVSLDKDIPVLMETKNGWCILTGYDSKHFIYGYDGTFKDKHIFADEIKEFWNDMFVLRNWHDMMESVVIVTGKQEPSITPNDIFKRIIRIIDDNQEQNIAADFIKKLEDDDYIASLTQKEQMELFGHTLNFFHFYSCSRGELCCSPFPFEPKTDRDLNLIQSINGILGSMYDYGWNTFGCLGYGMPSHLCLIPDEKAFSIFLTREARQRIVRNIQHTLFNDYKISCICKIIAGIYISDLECYLNEPKYNIPREQVGVDGNMGTFDTDVVMLPDEEIKYNTMPVSECNKNNLEDVFLIEFTKGQCDFYYNKNIMCGSSAGNDTCKIKGGRYLKINGNLPIGINNIVEGWYDNNGFEFAPGKKMIIEKNKNGEFTAYIPLMP